MRYTRGNRELTIETQKISKAMLAFGWVMTFALLIVVPIGAWFMHPIVGVGILVMYGLIFFLVWLGHPKETAEGSQEAQTRAVKEAILKDSSKSHLPRSTRDALYDANPDLAIRLEMQPRRSDAEDLTVSVAEIAARNSDRHAAEFAEEVWLKLWEKYAASPFTTDDVVALGNTAHDAENVLTYLNQIGVRDTVGLRTFVLSRGPNSLADEC